MASVGGVKLDSLRARLRLQDGMVEVDSLSIQSNVGVATAAGVVGLFGAAQSAPDRTPPSRPAG